MENKHQVHNLIILDESGSMESIKGLIIEGFNEIVQTIKGIEKQFPDQEHFISLLTFNGLGTKVLHFNEPVRKLQLINSKRYKPDASTPLYDAMGTGINMLRKVLETKTHYNVLVTILTDGEENASREYSGVDIKKMIEELKLNRWTFTYIGADHNVESSATSISITNIMNFNKNPDDMKMMFLKEKAARFKYSERVSEDKEMGEDYYVEEGGGK